MASEDRKSPVGTGRARRKLLSIEQQRRSGIFKAHVVNGNVVKSVSFEEFDDVRDLPDEEPPCR